MERTPFRLRGVSLIEMLGVIALLAILSAGVASLIFSSLEDTRGQHAGRHQSMVVDAADRYIRENYAALVTATAAAPVAVPVASLTEWLPAGFQAENAYGQMPCVRLTQPQPGRLNALIVTEGGRSIPSRDVAYVAAHAGKGGGQITAGEAGTARGAFGSWRVDTTPYEAITCSGTAADPSANRLASALFFDGPGSAAVDFLYRREVPGRPDLNALAVPLAMRGRAVVVENDTTDPLCSTADPNAQGRVAVNDQGALLTCQTGAWRRQGSAYWKDPVATAAALPMTDNNAGDVRLTLDTSRAFAWNGAGWQALAVDETGNLTVPRNILLTESVTRNTPCDTIGAISREADGLTVSCQNGRWRTLSATEVDSAQSEIGNSVILRSSYLAYPGGTRFYDGGYAYDAPNDTVMASVERQVTPTKDGLLISNASLDLAVGSIDAPEEVATVTLIAQVVDRDTGAVLAVNQARQTRMVYDRTILAVTLSKAVPRNVNGYIFQMLVRWSRHQYNYASNFYDRSNYRDAFGNVVELTPIHLSWNFDVTY